MKNFWKQFVLRGLMVCCAGPLIVAIIYLCINASGNLKSLTPSEVATAIFSSAIMAFIAGGITAIYTIENMPLNKALLLHGLILYVDYLAVYLLNSWLPLKVITIAMFTVIYVVTYSIISLWIYLATRKRTEKINKQIQSL